MVTVIASVGGACCVILIILQVVVLIEVLYDTIFILQYLVSVTHEHLVYWPEKIKTLMLMRLCHGVFIS